ncbi:phage tail tape measure protein [Georgenia sp. AZ-5]|uniref:phage tail tape measure protein n=1 Tax=Georgenia sp. AZ-5 TaxID=3367526 RepID=UPI0037552551
MSSLDLGTLRGHVELDIDAFERKYGEVDKLLAELERRQVKDVAIGADVTDAEAKIGQVQDVLAKVDGTTAVVQAIADTAKAESGLGGVDQARKTLDGTTADVTVTADTSKAESVLDNFEGTAGSAGGDGAKAFGAGFVGGLMATPIAGAVAGLIGDVVGEFRDALSIEADRDMFGARTGFDGATAAKYGRAAGEAYADAWGESVEGNLDTARIALQNGLLNADAAQADIERVVSSLSGVTDIMEADIPAAARAAGQLLKTGLVDTADQAFDVLIAGYQNGADVAEDFLDTLTEYPTHFRDLGLTAEEAAGLIIQGMEGGARNTDLVADALKELTIRVKDLSAEDALEKLGLDAEKMSDAFATGGPAARDALEEITSRLNEVEDPSDRAALAVQLFGTQAEDMAVALASLDLSTAIAELGDFEGAAAKALDRLGSNDQAKIDSAIRNVEVAANGIKGALASAFSDELGGAADWVARNRGPMMEFLLDAVNAALDFASSFVGGLSESGVAIGDFLAGPVADLLDGMGSVVRSMEWMPGDQHSIIEGIEATADAARETGKTLAEESDGMGENWGAALDEMRGQVNDWAAPEIISAHIHDAVLAATERLGELETAINETGGTVTINGDERNAQQVLDMIVGNIDEADGTVVINGNRVPAGDALDTVMGLIRDSEEDVKIGGDSTTAQGDVAGFKVWSREQKAWVPVDANTGPADATVGRWQPPPKTGIATYWAQSSSQLANWSPPFKIGKVEYRVTSRGGVMDMPIPTGRAGGGWIGNGLAAGGWVPGENPGPGIDNILWPLAGGGEVLSQPLAGGEYVTKASQAGLWGPLLEAINGGLKPGDLTGGTTATTTPVAGITSAQLAAQDRQLMREFISTAAGLANRPVETKVQINGRELFTAVDQAYHSYGVRKGGVGSKGWGH